MNSIIDFLLLTFFEAGTHAQLSVIATTDAESESWRAEALTTTKPLHVQLLARTLQRKQKRATTGSGVLQFDSSRQFSQVQPMQWQWNSSDPADEDMGWDFTLNSFQACFQDTIHAIHPLRSNHPAVERLRLMYVYLQQESAYGAYQAVMEYYL